MYSVLTDTNAVYSRPSGGSSIYYYGVILTADNKLMEADYKINPSDQEISNAQHNNTMDQLYARYRTVTNIDFSRVSFELALPKPYSLLQKQPLIVILRGLFINSIS